MSAGLALGLVYVPKSLIDVFTRSDTYTVSVYERLSDISEDFKFDMLIIGYNPYETNEINSSVESLFKSTNYKFLLLDRPLSGLTSVYIERDGFTILQSKSSSEQIYNTCLATVTSETVIDNVFVFFGADRKVGTTQVAQSVAQFISENSDKGVIYLDLSGHMNRVYIQDKELSPNYIYIQDVLSVLKSSMLTLEELGNLSAIANDNLKIIKGFNRLQLVRHLGEPEINYLLEKCRDIADVVIVDAGSLNNCVMNVAALSLIKNRFLITNERPNSHINYTLYSKNLLDDLGISNFNMVLNDMSDVSARFIGELCEHYGMGRVISAAPHIENSVKCEVTGRTLISYERRGSYLVAIRNLSNFMLEYLYGTSGIILDKSFVGMVKRLFRR